MIRLYVVKPIKHIFQAELEIWFKLVKPLVLLFEQIKLINVFINFITNFDFQSKLVAPGGARVLLAKLIPPLAALAVNCFRDKHCLELKWWYIPPFCLQNCFRDKHLVFCRCLIVANLWFGVFQKVSFCCYGGVGGFCFISIRFQFVV